MNYRLIYSKSNNSIQSEISLDSIQENNTSFFFKGITREQAKKFFNSYQERGELTKLLNEYGEYLDNFLIVVLDNRTSKVLIYNDFFGSNQIYFRDTEDSILISDSIFNLECTSPKLRNNAVYETIVFQGVQPPDTIFEGILTVPVGSFLEISNNESKIIEYWDLESMFKNKEQDYQILESKGRKALVESLKNNLGNYPLTALSGGIDSGGLLGMVVRETRHKAATVSIGGRGPETEDLESARKTVELHKSRHSEIYPSYNDLKSMWHYSKGLSQPIHSSALFSFDLVMSYAMREGYDSVVYGFGAEMLLGNLRISRVAKQLWFERFVPNFILKRTYKLLGSVLFKSETRRLFLSIGKDWPGRFMVVRGAHYAWQNKYFTKSKDDFWNGTYSKVERNFPVKLDLYDALVVMYLKSWVNYLQYRDVTAASKGVRPVMPFDSYRSAKIFFSVPTQHRMKNNWNKQLIRDIMRPYVADHLYSNPVRSLIIPYREWFSSRLDIILEYLESSDAVGNLFDFQLMKKNLPNEPEPGYFLMSLLGVAVWYDSNFKPERESAFLKLFDKQ